MDEKQNHITQNLIAPISNYYEILRKSKIAIKWYSPIFLIVGIALVIGITANIADTGIFFVA